DEVGAVPVAVPEGDVRAVLLPDVDIRQRGVGGEVEVGDHRGAAAGAVTVEEVAAAGPDHPPVRGTGVGARRPQRLAHDVQGDDGVTGGAGVEVEVRAHAVEDAEVAQGHRGARERHRLRLQAGRYRRGAVDAPQDERVRVVRQQHEVAQLVDL